MNSAQLFEWIAFMGFALISITGALGMATTMSMFRSGIFLMASFVGVAGLFILLSADLLSLLQIMMYIGGMLVMILFMVLFSHDPGGNMMAGMMKLPPIERFFSLGLASSNHHQDSDGQGEMKDGEDGRGEKTNQGFTAQERPDGDENRNDDVDEESRESAGKEGHKQDPDRQSGEMDMSDMSMTTPLKSSAAVLAVLIGMALVALLLIRPSWPIAAATPDPHSAEKVGSMLMGKYMIAFEGAGLLILIGIFGAVWVSRPGSFPDSGERGVRVIADEPPAAIDEARIERAVADPTISTDASVLDAHRDDRRERRDS